MRQADATRVLPDANRDPTDEELLRLLVQNSSDIITVLDPDATIRYHSPSIERVLGYRPEERIGKNVFEDSLVHPDDAPRMRALLDAILRTPGADLTAEFRLRHADGSWRQVEAIGTNLLHDPHVGGIVANYRDVTERKRAEDALRESERRFRSLAEALPQLVWSTRPDGWTDYFNRRWTDYTGLSFERSIGWGWCEALHLDDRPRCLERWHRATHSGGTFEVEYRLRGADGDYRWFLGRALPLRDAEGRITQWFGTCTDIDGQKRTEAKSLEDREVVEMASRAKDRFLAMLSHELRNPLNPILLAATAALQDDGTPPGHRSTFDMIRQNVELEARLIDDLLDLTRVIQGKMHFQWEVADVHALIERTFDICRSDWLGKRLKLMVDLGAGEHDVKADPARLQQVLWNLLKNAIKFTPEGGTITVRSRNEEGRLAIEVADTGIGIDPRDSARIFHAFEQAGDPKTRRSGGLGLGLAIARSIAEAHGGTLEASSPGRDRGATFSLSLPTVVAARPAERVSSPSAHPGRTQRGLDLLLVEDDPMTLHVMSKLLRGAGHRVTTAETVSDALATASPGFDLVVSDLGLPDGSGLDLMRRINEKYGLWGVALTGFGADEDVAKGREVGFLSHLTKPVDFPRLEEAIRQVAGMAEGRATSPCAPSCSTEKLSPCLVPVGSRGPG